MTAQTDARVAVVTGGARGIGRAIGEWFLRHDHCVALLDRDRYVLERTVAELAMPDRLLAVYCDVSDPAQVAQAAEDVIARFGRVDVLVNNAGVAVFKPVLETTGARCWPPTSTVPSFARRPLARGWPSVAAAPSSISPRSQACEPARCAWHTAPARRH
jgi:NAD(P)-dependent dehydrogenase (short-subunit alcohol dehydrogenase family)